MRGVVLQRTTLHPASRGGRRWVVKCTTTEGDLSQATKLEYSKNGRRRIPVAPFKVVITGSTKGIGYQLAREFVRAGDEVIISSRNYSNVRQAVKSLHEEFGQDINISGVTCDVSKEREVSDLADYARDEFGSVHLWINNAGTNAYQYTTLSEFTESDLREILETNMLGVMLACKEAVRVMRYQHEDGHIFNMEGAGANGRPTPRFAAYGATKRAITQFNDSLIAELKLLNISNIGVHTLSPGMCVTDLLMCGNLTSQSKFFINCLAEPPEIPAQHLVPLVRQVPQETGIFGIRSKKVEYLTQTKAYSQIFKRLLFNERKDRHVQEG